MSIGANETEIKYWTDYANPRDGICFRKEDAHMLVHEHYELERINAENAKLRELVRHLYACNYYTGLGSRDIRCDLCEYDNCAQLCDFEARMRELGMEVDG